MHCTLNDKRQVSDEDGSERRRDKPGEQMPFDKYDATAGNKDEL